MQFLLAMLLPFALRLHTFSYKLVSKCAVAREHGLHPKHRLMKYHQFFVDHVEANDRVLDVGCGNGSLAFDVAQKAKHVVGVDIVPHNIERAKKMHSRENIVYRVADATKDLTDERFDVVILSNVLEHIKDRDIFLQRIRGLAPRFLIRVPMITRDWLTLYKKEQGVEWRLDSTHYTEYTWEAFVEELEKVGFEIQDHQIIFGEIWAVCIPHSVV